MPLGGEREIRDKAFDADRVNKTQKRKSRKQERQVAKHLGGSRVALSGAHDKAKGDVKTELNLFELKRTAKKSIRIERDWLEKITLEALAEGKTPAFSFRFDEYENAQLTPRDWVTIPASFFKELLDGRE